MSFRLANTHNYEQFRRYKDKLASLEDSEDRQRDGEGDEDTRLEWTKEEENAILSRPSYLEHKRASEPTLGYNSPQPLPGYVREPQTRPSFRTVGYESSACSSPTVGDISSTGSPSPNPLGLKSVYAFEVPEVDLVFVHGLGGTSVRTWSWGHNTVNFWPPWLSSDPELRKSRIFTFGYDATMGGKYTSSNILDFAKDLLFQLKTYVPEYGVGGGVIGTVCMAPTWRTVWHGPSINFNTDFGDSFP